MILNAEDKLTCDWNMIYSASVREQIAAQIERIQRTAKAVARLDVFASLALVAERNHYVRPVLNEKGRNRYQRRPPSGSGTDDRPRYVHFQ